MARKPRWMTISAEELKKMEKKKVEVKCAFCNGTGVYPRKPHSVVCPKCKGRGVVAK